jgi:UDP-N-acetylglucosamine--N-acetylmuramyl-(pentapeptide) pyrophosphoryl-undecaprenol N-acetylglucosamine transferase
LDCSSPPTGDNTILKLKHYYNIPLPANAVLLLIWQPLQRANLAVSRAGSGTLTELAITHTPFDPNSYPFAVEDHQAFNAAASAESGAALVFPQTDLNSGTLSSKPRAFTAISCKF